MNCAKTLDKVSPSHTHTPTNYANNKADFTYGAGIKGVSPMLGAVGAQPVILTHRIPLPGQGQTHRYLCKQVGIAKF